MIGEAARLIPAEIERRHPVVPWARMRGMRTVVVHAYFGVDDAILRETATRNPPPLAERLREIHGRESADGEPPWARSCAIFDT